MYKFEPIADAPDLKVPFLEAARADYAPYYATEKWNVSDAQSAVAAEIAKLGGGILRFIEGNFIIQGQKRRGYQIEFIWRSARGRILVAGLPIEKTETDKKLEQVKIQALLNVRDWLKAAVTARIFSPGEHPLIPHLILENGQTLAEQMIERLGLPELPGADHGYIDGEVTEVREH
jgi:hypothetical protein